jgi:hypothetical protein
MTEDEQPIIEITQNGITTTLKDVYFSPASSHFENAQAYVIESSISASCDVVLQDGPAELSYDEETFAVEISVLEFDEDEDDIDDVAGENAACHIMIDSADLELEKLAERLELEG